ncbi:MAG: DUF547 domain-containing protein [Candidatus Omnitrophica bacterium]|nr:DUF547 domain-containing protein [Candidatus Omnitrophota bacterium]
MALLVFCGNLGSPAFAESDDYKAEWSQLLSSYLDERSFVDYKSWKNNAEDLARLNDLVKYFDDAEIDFSVRNKHHLALLINAYNAFVTAKVLKQYPLDNVQAVPKFFSARDYKLSGEAFSLNEIEGTIRSFGDQRIFSALSNAVKSAPPLRKQAYTEGKIELELEEQMKRWLSNATLNEFDCSDGKIGVSPVFLWYKSDFGGDDDKIKEMLMKYGPPGIWRRQVMNGRCVISYMAYDHSLNDSNPI